MTSFISPPPSCWNTAKLPTSLGFGFSHLFTGDYGFLSYRVVGGGAGGVQLANGDQEGKDEAGNGLAVGSFGYPPVRVWYHLYVLPLLT